MIDVDEKENKFVIDRFQELKTTRAKYLPLWKDVQNLVSITDDVNYEFIDKEDCSKQKDVCINDPTAFISTNQAGDYLAGILWGLDAITLEPSDYIKKKANGADLEKFYKKATDITLKQINSTDAGFQSILKSYCYEQFSFGTSGIGVFKSKEFEREQSECCLTFKPFGVYNTCIDEGADNKINVVYTVYNWRLNQIIEEFCINDKDEISKKLLSKMPDVIKKAYEDNNFNQKFKIVFAMLPNNHFCMAKRGKVGARFKGYWFLDNSDKKIFKVDYFKKMPIAICRAIRVNNQVYGTSTGTLAISSIKMINHIAGNTVDNIEKTTDSPLGILSGALVAGNVINRSAASVTMFNSQAMQNGQNPVFPFGQPGDISAVISFLIPELKKNITNIFKIDQLLDFNNQTQMTASEASMRMSIRGKAISGLISQQKQEEIEPICHRCIQIIQDCGLYGYELSKLPETNEEEIAIKEQIIKDGDYVPDVVEKAMKDNIPWYEIKFNGELEKLLNAEIYDAIGRFLQYLNSILQIKPDLIHAIKDYEFLELLKYVSNLINSKFIKSKTAYNEIIQKIEKERELQALNQTMLQQAQMMKDGASVSKDIAQAQNNMEF